jgi:hypothetical protein
MNELFQILAGLAPLLLLGFIFGGDSESNQSQTTATDEGQIAGGKGSIAAREQSFVVGPKAAYTETGSLQAKSITNSTVHIGLSPEALSGIAGQFSQASAAQISAFQDVLARQQEQIGTLAENSQTGESKTTNQSFTWIVLAAIGGLILVLWRKL